MKSLYEIPPGCICQGDGLLGMRCPAPKHATANAVSCDLIADNERLRAALAKIRSEVDRIAHGKQDEVCDDFTAGYADGCTAISYHIEEIVTIALAQPVSSVGGSARNAERT